MKIQGLWATGLASWLRVHVNITRRFYGFLPSPSDMLQSWYVSHFPLFGHLVPCASRRFSWTYQLCVGQVSGLDLASCSPVWVPVLVDPEDTFQTSMQVCSVQRCGQCALVLYPSRPWVCKDHPSSLSPGFSFETFEEKQMLGSSHTVLYFTFISLFMGYSQYNNMKHRLYYATEILLFIHNKCIH